MSNEKLYAERDPEALDEAGEFYCRHVWSMTREGLHSKSAIAAELGYRDMQIAALEASSAELLAELEKLTDFTVRYIGDAHVYEETIRAMAIIERHKS